MSLLAENTIMNLWAWRLDSMPQMIDFLIHKNFPAYDTAFRCICRNWLMYNSTKDIGQTVICWHCKREWRVVSDPENYTAVETVYASDG